MRRTIVLICPKVTYVCPGGPGSKDPLTSAGAVRDSGSVPGVRKISWRRKW